MIGIDMEMPKGCQHCKFFRKHTFGNGLDYSYSCMLGATEFPMPWIRQMEERADDCPLVEIGICKDCKRYNRDEMFCTWHGGYLMQKCDPNYHCADFKKRGDSDGSD